MAVVALTCLLVAACTGSDDESTRGRSDPDPGDPTTSTTGPAEASGVSAAEGSFSVPEELLDRVRPKGFEIADVEYPDQPEGAAWPTSEWDRAGLPEGVDAAEVIRIVQSAFSAGYTAAEPLEAEPDTHWEYSTGTSDVIAREVAYEVGFGEEYERTPLR